MARSLLCLSRTRIDIPNLPPAHTFLCVRFKTLRSELGAVPITDILTKEERSALMAKVKGKNTKPEIYVRKYLFSKGFRYRVNDPRYPGRPDIILPKYRTAIFVHGCFWHGHESCKYARLPLTNREFWENKIRTNIERDKRNIELLKQEGWKVVVVWQCELRNRRLREERMKRLVEEIEADEEPTVRSSKRKRTGEPKQG